MLQSIILLCILLFAMSANAAINISVTVGGVACDIAGDSCPAPQALFFDATATSCSASECGAVESANNSFRSLQYTWDFGDPGNGNWTEGAAALEDGQDKNIEYGPIAFHVYDSDGTYTVTLTVTDGTTTVVKNDITVIIDVADTIFAAGDTRCYSKGTDFLGCPSGADQKSNETGDWATLVNTTVNTDGKHRVLFESDQTWTIGASVSINTAGPVYIGVYGATGVGGSERTALSDTSQNAVACSQQHRWTFENFDVTWTGANSSFYDVIAGAACDDLLFYKLSGEFTHNFIELTSVTLPNDIFIISDGQIINGTAINNEPCNFAIAHNFVFAGIDFREDCEREIRMSKSTTLSIAGPTIISHITFPLLAGASAEQNIDGRGTDGDPDAGGEGGHRYIKYADNLFASPLHTGFSISSCCDPVLMLSADVLVERNRFDITATFGTLGAITNENGRRVTIRNNLVTTASASAPFYAVRSNGGSGWKKDNHVLNNSIYVTADLTLDPVYMLAGALHEASGSVCKNNIFWNTVTATEEGCPKAVTQENNAGRAAGEEITITAIPFAGTPDGQGALSLWELNNTAGGGADCRDGGETIQDVLRDFINAARPAGAGYDIGALETDVATGGLRGGGLSGGAGTSGMLH